MGFNLHRFLRLLLLFMLIAPTLALAQQRLLPRDEAASVPDFFTFRAQLQAAIARRDRAAVVAVLHKDVKLSFGGDAGVAGFNRLWKPSARESRLWETLATVLALGGTFSADGSFTAPYVFTKWPQDVDAFSHRAAIGSGIRVRAGASATATVVGALDFSIVETIDPQPADERWVQVKTSSGSPGFVDARHLRSPIDYRANFVKIDGRWQMTMFLAGD